MSDNKVGIFGILRRRPLEHEFVVLVEIRDDFCTGTVDAVYKVGDHIGGSVGYLNRSRSCGKGDRPFQSDLFARIKAICAGQTEDI